MKYVPRRIREAQFVFVVDVFDLGKAALLEASAGRVCLREAWLSFASSDTSLHNVTRQLVYRAEVDSEEFNTATRAQSPSRRLITRSLRYSPENYSINLLALQNTIKWSMLLAIWNKLWNKEQEICKLWMAHGGSVLNIAHQSQDILRDVVE